MQRVAAFADIMVVSLLLVPHLYLEARVPGRWSRLEERDGLKRQLAVTRSALSVAHRDRSDHGHAMRKRTDPGLPRHRKTTPTEVRGNIDRHI
jgi:hypothetical protein